MSGRVDLVTVFAETLAKAEVFDEGVEPEEENLFGVASQGQMIFSGLDNRNH